MRVSTIRARTRGLTWHPMGAADPVLAGIDLEIGAGERIGLVGASGAGKSTLVHALAGVLGEAVPGELAGEVVVDGTTGLVLQDPGAAVVADRIGRDVAFGPENLGLSRDEIWQRVRESLAAVRLLYGVDHPTSALSGGELQRLALAGVLALRPGLLLLDEPTSMLDPEHAAAVREAVLAAVGPDTALVVVDHHLGPWLPHLDRVLVLDGGSLVHDTSPGALLGDLAPRLTDAGVWLPGVPDPDPLAIPASLVGPDEPGPDLRCVRLGVDLLTRRARGTGRSGGDLRSVVLEGLDAAVPTGRVTAVTGPTGAGKSTLIAVLAGLLAPTRGHLVGGATNGRSLPLHRLSSRSLAARLGWVPQQPEHGFVAVTVADEVARTSRLLHRNVEVDQVLEVLGLAHRADVNPYRLSGGEQRRLALAGALAHRPPLALLDEPTVGQDRRTWAAVVGWLEAAAGAGATVAAASHDRALVDRAQHRIVLQRREVGQP